MFQPFSRIHFMTRTETDNCDFCGRPGHNVKTCNHPTIRIACNRIHDKIKHLVINESKDAFLFYFENMVSVEMLHLFVSRTIPSISTSYPKRVIVNNMYRYCAEYYSVDIEQHNNNQHIANNTEDILLQNTQTQTQTQTQPENVWREAHRINQQMISTNVASRSTTNNHSKINNKTKYLQYLFLEETNCSVFPKSECPVCYDEIEKLNYIQLQCSHVFCVDCIKKCFTTNTNKMVLCPYCREEIKGVSLYNEYHVNNSDLFV